MGEGLGGLGMEFRGGDRLDSCQQHGMRHHEDLCSSDVWVRSRAELIVQPYTLALTLALTLSLTLSLKLYRP